MATYGDMVNRIANEIRRQNLTTEIKLAIQTAIAHYEATEFFFNQARAQATTSPSERFYPLPTDFVYTIGRYPLEITNSNNTYPLIQRSWDELQLMDNDDLTRRSVPTDWAYFEQQFRIYPAPDDTLYPLILSYVKKLDSLVLDTAYNAWTNEAEELIRMHAKADVYTNIINDYEKAEIMRQGASRALGRLNRQTGRMNLTGRIVPCYL